MWRETGFMAFALALLFLAACAPDAERSQSRVASGDKVELVNALTAAFNVHDAGKMREYWSEDVTWIEISGNQSSVVTDNADDLHDELVRYFETFPEVSSDLDAIAVNGSFLSGVETVVWNQDGERQSQSSLVVYEILDGKVKRFWYYPSQ